MLAALGLASGQDLALFMGAVLLLNATPGADLLLTVTRTLKGGPRAGVAAALGINVGCLVHTLAASFGLAAVLAVSATAFTLVKGIGAAYLLWLAWGLWRDALRGPVTAVPGVGAPLVRGVLLDFRVGLITNLLNPKVALFFLAFIPQFIAPGTSDKARAFIALGLVFFVQSLLFLLVVVWIADRFRQLGASRGMVRWLQLGAGAVFAGLALRLATARQA